MYRRFPLLCPIIEYAESIPMQTADRETDFSQINLIKSDIRNCLPNENLNKLLMFNIFEPTCKELSRMPHFPIFSNILVFPGIE